MWLAYHDLISKTPILAASLRLPERNISGHNAHIFQVRLADGERRHAYLKGLAAAGIQAVTHYVPLHNSPFGSKVGRSSGSLSVTQNVSETLFRLPLWIGLDPERVVEGLLRVVTELEKGVDSD